ncbi:Hsp20/alpha crystallin family protein [Halobacillus salinarum]|uniref:Hsp20/alpha crystallin family protein n=1 Tax=Halobacillus salinarum TaxID=2932257 RepID=A0ABY4EMV1_9BACI|nr:Hsp20/alpha crystallin family protein [Halobacillus salinarum]UOQ45463.1 Hsp20/alpha crystallin family protein [Halobacillus salinarum]
MAGLIPFNNRNRSLRKDVPGNLFNMIDDFFNDSWFPTRNPMLDTFKVDVKETEHQYFVEAELPGVKKEDIHLRLNDGRLTISVHKEENVEEKDHDTYIHKERRYDSMQRSLYLEDAKSDDVSAKLEDGLLKITVAKEDNPDNSRNIEIE